MEKERNRNLDLLRIVSMLMVVFQHAFGWGGLLNDVTPAYGTANWYICQIGEAFCLVAVNCFVLISGYFLCTSQFKLKKWFSIWGQALFYSVGIYLILAIVRGEATEFSIKELLKCTLVFTMDRYWFVTDYLLLYAVFPILNFAIQAMNQRQHLTCCFTLLGLFSLLPNLAYVSDFSEANGGSSLIWFCTLYILSAYFRLYVPEQMRRQKWTLPGYILCALFICGERFLAYTVTPHIFGVVKLSSFFYAKNSVCNIAASLLLFQFFRGLKIQGRTASKLIGVAAPLTFAVYLIHDNPTLRSVLWDWINLPLKAESPLLIVYVLIAVLCIFAACCMIEYGRKWIFKTLYITNALHQLCDNIQHRFAILFHL